MWAGSVELLPEPAQVGSAWGVRGQEQSGDIAPGPSGDRQAPGGDSSLWPDVTLFGRVSQEQQEGGRGAASPVPSLPPPC